MSFAGLVVGLEAIVIAGSGIDARWRPAADRRLWLARWVWWHLAPLWFPWRLLISALMAAAIRAAQRTCARYLRRRADSPPLVLSAADDSAPTSLEAPQPAKVLPVGRLRGLTVLIGFVGLLRAKRSLAGRL